MGISNVINSDTTIRQKPDRIDPEYTQIPRNLYELHKFVTLAADMMFVNDIQFLVTLSRDIRLFTAELLPSRTAKQLSSSLNNIVKFYARGGFVVRLVLMDMEFEKIKHIFDKVEVNTTAAREHVGEIERGIRLMKERSQCFISDLRNCWVYTFSKNDRGSLHLLCLHDAECHTSVTRYIKKILSPRDCHR